MIKFVRAKSNYLFASSAAMRSMDECIEMRG